jgi:hypothetical protein
VTNLAICYHPATEDVCVAGMASLGEAGLEVQHTVLELVLFGEVVTLGRSPFLCLLLLCVGPILVGVEDSAAARLRAEEVLGAVATPEHGDLTLLRQCDNSVTTVW